ncbi:MAG: Crp/Fnr family transcriptional regulator [Saprospiraceae bacterium]|nr:Crp/Fnr family transcriptional regulator [Lewinella sp.]
MKKHFLYHIFPPDLFSGEELDAILSAFKKVTFGKGDFLLMEGNAAHYYWFVETGFLRAYAVDTEGNDVSTNFFTTGDIAIDWSSFFQRKPTKENIQALTECICWQLDFDTFQHLFHGIETFRESGRARLVASYFELKQHSVSLITDQAKDRYKRLLAEKPAIFQNVPLKQIASYLGITDTSLSRIRKEVAQEK